MTAPNSRCPVCDVAVYYYESPFGGRVFFDELGPPWPKHPCTDNGVAEKSGKTSKGAWHASDWSPLIEASIEQANSGTNVYSLTGMRDSRKYRFYFKSNEIVMAEIIRVKPLHNGVASVSILDFDAPCGEWAVWTGSIFTTEAALKVGGGPLKRTKLHSHFLKHPVGNALLHSVPKIVVALRSAHHAESTIHSGNSAGRLNANLSELIQCPDCPARMNRTHLIGHLRHIHNYVPLGTAAKVTGRMLLS